MGSAGVANHIAWAPLLAHGRICLTPAVPRTHCTACRSASVPCAQSPVVQVEQFGLHSPRRARRCSAQARAQPAVALAARLPCRLLTASSLAYFPPAALMRPAPAVPVAPPLSCPSARPCEPAVPRLVELAPRAPASSTAALQAAAPPPSRSPSPPRQQRSSLLRFYPWPLWPWRLLQLAHAAVVVPRAAASSARWEQPPQLRRLAVHQRHQRHCRHLQSAEQQHQQRLALEVGVVRPPGAPAAHPP
jgi:hypothetical protein